MRATLVSLLVASLLSSSALAEPPAVSAPARGRGWLSGAGVALLGAGLVAGVIGLNFQRTADQTSAVIQAYYPPNNPAPLPSEASSVALLESRRNVAQGLAVPLLVGGGVALVGGLLALIFDGVLASSPVTVTVAPTRAGGVVLVGARL